MKKISYLILFFIMLGLVSCNKDDDEPVPLVEKERVSGVVQKGPFISGTRISMNELNGNFQQTGKIFTTELDGDDGKFAISNVTLRSGFVQLNGDGFYYNEVTGELSSAQLNLFALSDVTRDTSININLITHLERRRVEYLVSEKTEFSEAKRMAQSEILQIFGFGNDGLDKSEKIDITQQDQSGAMLLAISVILQGNRTVAQLSELLANISTDLKEDGQINNEGTMTALRTSAKSLDLASIRTNLTNRYNELEVTASIPNFEQKVKDFLAFTSNEPSIEEFTTTEIRSYEITLSTSINPNSAETQVTIDYGLTNTFGTQITPEGSPFSGADPVTLETNIKDLLADTTYYLRVVAENFKGETISDTLQINTAATYTLDVTLEGEGSVSKSPDLEVYQKDSVVTLTATANEGHKFTGWSGDLTSSETSVEVTMDANKSITATFEQITSYSITLTTEGSGTVTKAPDAESYQEGTKVTLTATPSEGYSFTGWSGDLTSSETSVEVTMDANKSITATFEQITSYSITLTTEGSGTVTKAPDAESYQEGTKVTLTATPSEGYSFTGWSGDLTSSETSVEVTMDANKSITATFEKTSFAINLTLNGEGTVTKDPDQSLYASGTAVTLTAVPNEGHRFTGWTGDRSSSELTIVVVTNKDQNITANFEKIPTYGVNLTIEGQGSVTKDPNQESYLEDTKVNLTASPNDGFIFAGWSGDITSGETTIEVTMSADKNITAKFTPIYTLNITANGQGSFTKSPDKESYDAGEKVTLTATANDGYRFTGWTGDLTSSEASVEVTMDANKNITANFIAIYSLNITVEGQGSVTKSPDKESYDAGEKVTLTATANSGHKFKNWTGDIKSTTSSVEVTMDANKSFIANFEQESYTLSVTADGNGTVTKSPDQTSYLSGTKVTLTANSNDGYKLTSWSGDASGSSTSIEITMDANKSITATFKDMIWLGANGVTVFCTYMDSGEKATLNAIEYEAVDRSLLLQRVNENADMSKICVSPVTSMESIFKDKETFNQPLENWDVSNVNSMKSMFSEASSFNQPLENWDVSNVTDMQAMFSTGISGSAFNQPLNNWNVSNVTIMQFMFSNASSFNQPLDNWDVSKVNSMWSMFINANSFNQSLNDWDVSSVEKMQFMFSGATTFNQPLNNWDVSNVTNMWNMFNDATNYNQDLSKWCVTKISTEPESFSTGSALTSSNKPVWGTCPGG